MGILPGSTQYPELQFKPERRSPNSWTVWCASGALEVIQRAEYETCLGENPTAEYIIFFGNNSAAQIQPGHQLWKALQKVAETFLVQVFPLNFSDKYTDWIGAEGDIRAFDGVRIAVKPSN